MNLNLVFNFKNLGITTTLEGTNLTDQLKSNFSIQAAAPTDNNFRNRYIQNKIKSCTINFQIIGLLTGPLIEVNFPLYSIKSFLFCFLFFMDLHI